MMVVQARGLVSKSKTGKNLRGLYDIWSKLVRPSTQCGGPSAGAKKGDKAGSGDSMVGNSGDSTRN
jgi:hypothetical protein